MFPEQITLLTSCKCIINVGLEDHNKKKFKNKILKEEHILWQCYSLTRQ